LYPFGYGLSYSAFHYSNPQVSEVVASGKTLEKISVDVANAGRAAAEEVVELYLTHQGVVGAPLRELKGFRRVHLLPGGKRSVVFTLSERELSSVDEIGQRRVIPGEVTVWMGGAQPIVSPRLAKPSGVATSFKITNGVTLSD
jgi:beta-glucosidase